MNRCLKCGASIEKDAGVGRPKSYCSVACRRAAELEIRRVAARIADLEAQLMRTRLPGYWELTPASSLAAEIARQEARLAQLLAASEEADVCTTHNPETAPAGGVSLGPISAGKEIHE